VRKFGRPGRRFSVILALDSAAIRHAKTAAAFQTQIPSGTHNEDDQGLYPRRFFYFEMLRATVRAHLLINN
jgi:hypothetical protein